MKIKQLGHDAEAITETFKIGSRKVNYFSYRIKLSESMFLNLPKSVVADQLRAIAEHMENNPPEVK